MYFREDMCDIRVTIDNVPYGESWYSIEGANLESDDSKTRPGGMGDEVSLGGPGSRDDATVQIQLTDITLGWHPTLELKSSEDAPVKVSYTFLDRLKNPVGRSHAVTGTLKSAHLPDMDTGSSDAAMYEIIVSCDERAA